MGGHGGLNILPQKRWNVYRRDNKERVARDEAEDLRRQCEEAARKRSENLDRKIGFLRERRVLQPFQSDPTYGNTDTPDGKDDVNNLISDQPEAQFGNPDSSSGQRCSSNRQKERSRSSKIASSNVNSAHINFFEEEEMLYVTAHERHRKYLTEVSHDPTQESDFDRVMRATEVPWYMQKRRDPEATESTGTEIAVNNGTSDKDTHLLSDAWRGPDRGAVLPHGTDAAVKEEKKYHLVTKSSHKHDHKRGHKRDHHSESSKKSHRSRHRDRDHKKHKKRHGNTHQSSEVYNNDKYFHL